jgi:alkyl sulfatase BDS1-like metallo-beta-lactamase superfamily hydrolase
VETVTPGIYVVKGVGKSNVVALVGDTGWILIDSNESPTNMQISLLLLRPYLGARKLKGLIYTSEDYAHYSGSSVVAPLFSIPVWASGQFSNELARQSAVAGTLFPRVLMTIGAYLPESPDWRIGQFVNRH